MNGQFNGTSGITDSLHSLSLIYNIFAKNKPIGFNPINKKEKIRSKLCNCALIEHMVLRR